MDLSIVIPLIDEAESLPELTAWIEKVMNENQLQLMKSFLWMMAAVIIHGK